MNNNQIPPSFCNQFRKFLFATKDNKKFWKVTNDEIVSLFNRYEIREK